MPARVTMILGRNRWSRTPDGWRPHGTAEGRPQPIAAGEVLIFEPQGLGHQSVEIPKVGRGVFASLEKVRHEFPVVGSDALGWGIEPPEPAPGGSYATLLHFELTPALIDLVPKGGIRAAWSAFTVAMACLGRRRPSDPARNVLFLLPGFVAVASCGGGRRSFKAFGAPLTDRDWKALRFLLGDFETRGPGGMTEVELRRSSILVIAEGDPGAECPCWKEIQTSGRVEGILDLDAVAQRTESLARSLGGNLAASFPFAFNLDRLLVLTGVAGCSAAALLVLSVASERRILRAEASASLEREAGVFGEVSALERNRVEMEALRRELPGEGEMLPRDRGSALQALSAGLPDAATLNAFSLGKDEDFKIEATITAPPFDPEAGRRQLAATGFSAETQGGWAYDPGAGTLVVRGKFAPSRP